jgi:acetyltransferase-like isoleucine patch superfamily enzyme
LAIWADALRLWGGLITRGRPRDIPLGRGNRLRIADGSGLLFWVALKLDKGARNNVIEVGRNFRRGRLTVIVRGEGHTLKFGDDVRWAGEVNLFGRDLTVSIGDRCDSRRVTLVAREADIEIGPDCLFSHRIEVRSSDAHRILDRKSGERLNPGAPVSIGEHCWIGAHAFISKGVRLAPHTVVGARSLVTGQFDDSHVVIAGSPARILRENIDWRR